MVNSDVPGGYVLVYIAEDSAGNQAVPVERLVTVQENCIEPTTDSRPQILVKDDTPELML